MAALLDSFAAGWVVSAASVLDKDNDGADGEGDNGHGNESGDGHVEDDDDFLPTRWAM